MGVGVGALLGLKLTVLEGRAGFYAGSSVATLSACEINKN